MIKMKYFSILCAVITVGLAAPNLRTELRSIANRNPHLGIINGTDADIKDFPYHAAALYNDQYLCGAEIISYDTVLSAAHCFEGFDTNSAQLSVRVGSSLWSSGGQQISVKEVINHENFTYTDLGVDYDIAILKLNGTINVENAVPLSLPEGNSTYPDGQLTNVTGWGMTEDGTFPDNLKAVQVPVVNASFCRQAYGDIITERTICAGYTEGGKDSCGGDSGGPLAINGVIVGIVSFGRGCAEPNNPGVYAAVPAFREWIRQHTGL